MNYSQAYLDFCAYSMDIGEAMFLASDWHSGQWSSLYMLSCGVYDKWDAEDIDGMIAEFSSCLYDIHGDYHADSEQIQNAIDGLNQARAFLVGKLLTD